VKHLLIRRQAYRLATSFGACESIMRQPPRVAAVKKFEVAFRPAAVADLDALYDTLPTKAGC
jgi:hypothetical protein